MRSFRGGPFEFASVWRVGVSSKGFEACGFAGTEREVEVSVVQEPDNILEYGAVWPMSLSNVRAEIRRLATPARWLLILGAVGCFVGDGRAGEDRPYAPKVEGPSEEGKLAIRKFRVPAGLSIELFAAEPLLANPVAFGVDEKNRFYVAETFRLHAGVTDIRGHMNWLDDDLASRTVADRVRMYRKYLGKDFATYEAEHDRIRLVEDRDGDGKADRSTVFADGFRTADAGIGAGVLARKGTVWFTCIPDLWMLRDGDGDGKAEVKKSLQHGYGVHVGFLGHDLHGLKFGPDGRLYFSVGDRGLNVRTFDGRHVVNVESGSVLRCEPDGSELEIFASGLRNPQELAFNELGDLFTCDNNSDGGDRARWVHLVEGGDGGWRIGYQFIEHPNSRGVWNAEKLWYPSPENSGLYLLPPLLNISDGPSGLTYDPGVSLLPESLRKHFFLADFRGGSGQSGVRSLALEPNGASYRGVDGKQFLWSILATDVDFGTDGALYVSDWVEGWNKPNKGRLYRIFDPGRVGDAKVREVRRLLAEGFDRRSLDELAGLIGHEDMRVRQGAQFALADKKAAETLSRIAREDRRPLARYHAVWGLGQIGKRDPKALEAVVGLLKDDDAELRAQAARVVGDRKAENAEKALIEGLGDRSPRVRFQCALALGRLKARGALPAVLKMLRDDAGADPYLRHAGVMALAGGNDRQGLIQASGDESASVRLAIALALRRLGDPEVKRFLNDRDPRIVLEAARAINDVPIVEALEALAPILTRREISEPLGRRAINATFRVGGPASAEALATFAKRTDVAESLRVEALEDLGDWSNPPGRDPIVGVWRPIKPRAAKEAGDAVGGIARDLLSVGPDSVRQATARAVGRLGVKNAEGALAALASDRKASGASRAEALKSLDLLNAPALASAVKLAVDDPDETVRVEGRRLLVKVRPAEAVKVLDRALVSGSLAERQAALATLGRLDDPAADEVLKRWLDRLIAGRTPDDMKLDLIEAASARSNPEIRRKLARFEASRPKNDPLAFYRESLVGGDPRRGMNLFVQKAEVSCLRCHAFNRRGQKFGGEVGPDLSDVGLRLKREEILESIVAPNKKIAQGFETVVLSTAEGKTIVGVFKSENDKDIHVMTPEGNLIVVAKSDIDERKRGESAMPSDTISKLSKSELRDLVEFLSTLKRKPGPR